MTKSGHLPGARAASRPIGRPAPVLLATLALVLGGCRSAPPDPRPPVRTVAEVDLPRYLGRWYEVAHFPMFFQRKCLGDTTADYAVRADGRIAVTNRCRTAGGTDQAEGVARVVPASGNARLRVSFFWPFEGDYWVIGLDPEYRWAVVGHPERTYLWVLSRTPSLPEADLQAALGVAVAQGYDLAPLKRTAHGGR